MRIWAAAAGLALLACGGDALPVASVYPAGTPFRTRDLVVDGTRLRLIDTGRGPAVVFIHGLAASIYSWRHQLEPVLQAGHRVVAFDNRGFGFSDHPEHGYTNADYARLVVALLDSLRIEDAILVGHSMGGAIAADVALADPGRVRGLVLIDPAGYGPSAARVARWPGVRDLGVALVSRTAAAATLRLCYADPRRVTPADVDQYYAPLKSGASRAALRHVLRAFHFDALRGRVAELPAPTLIIWGDGDRWIPFQAVADLAADLPRAAFVVVRGAGHNPQEEQPAEVARLLTAFLQYGLPAVPPDLAADRSNAAARSTPSRTHAGSRSGAAG